MDTSVSPTVDFYRYANGGWLDSNPVPPEYGSWGAFHEVVERNEDLLHEILEEAAAREGDVTTPAGMVGSYFASGMDTDGIEAAGLKPLAPLLEAIAAVDDVAAIRGAVTRLHPAGMRAFFGGYVTPDFDDSTVNLLYVGQGGLGLPERDYYTRDDEQSVQLRALYQQHVAAQLVNLGRDASAAAEDAAAILEFETALAESSLTAAEQRDVELTTNKHTTDDLAELTPTLRLDRYLDGIGAGVGIVNIDHPGFFSALDELVVATPVATVRAYLRWHLVRSTASALPPVFEDEAFRFYGQTLGGQQEQRERWKRVLSAAGADIGEQVGQLFVAAAFSPRAKARCEELVDGLLDSMAASIEALEWMSAETKQQAREKLGGFSYKIGYPDEWRDYTGLAIDRGPFVVNRLRAAHFEFDRNIGKLNEPVDEKEWSMPPHAVNAYYHPLRNEIVFPAGILQPPFFYEDADDAVNYGGIGAVIGHEITHGFDDQGSRFDAAGHLRDWWTTEDREEFEARAAVMVDQFNHYEVADDLTVNGQLTLGENIADLGGVAIAYAALAAAQDGAEPGPIDGLTASQRFFLAYATVWRRNYTDEYIRLLVNTDPHSPSHYRVIGPLSNFMPFREAFAPSDDESMLRDEEEIVTIW